MLGRERFDLRRPAFRAGENLADHRDDEIGASRP